MTIDNIKEEIQKANDVVILTHECPFKEEEYQRTLEDDLELLEIVKKDNLELNPDSRLFKLGKELGII